MLRLPQMTEVKADVGQLRLALAEVKKVIEVKDSTTGYIYQEKPRYSIDALKNSLRKAP